MHSLRRKRQAPGTGGKPQSAPARHALCATCRVAGGDIGCVDYGRAGLWNHFGDNFPYNLPQLITNLICGLVIGSAISLLAFMGLGVGHAPEAGPAPGGMPSTGRKRLLESRLGKPVTTPSRDDRAGRGDGRTVRVANQGDASPLNMESVPLHRAERTVFQILLSAFLISAFSLAKPPGNRWRSRLGPDAAPARAQRQALVLVTGWGEHPIATGRFPGLLCGT